MTTNSTTTTTNSTLAWRRDGAREDESDATARIRAVAPYLVGPVAARLRALTATLAAALVKSLYRQETRVDRFLTNIL